MKPQAAARMISSTKELIRLANRNNLDYTPFKPKNVTQLYQSALIKCIETDINTMGRKRSRTKDESIQNEEA